VTAIIKLPDGWAEAKIGEICLLVNGRAFKPTEWSTKGLPIIRIQNLNNPDANYNYCDFDVDNKYYVSEGDLLFAWSGTPGTSFGAHIWRYGKAVLNQHIFRVDIDEENINKLYLMYCFNYKVDEYISKAHGTAGLAHITKNKFQESYIPIPPLTEQTCIVAKIEELFTKLDAGVDSLKRVQAQLKRYRQSMLKAAVEGRLTAEWREENKNELEPADKLLEHIQNEQKARLGKKYKEPKPIDKIDLPALPEKWDWARIKDVSTQVTVGHVGPMKNEYKDNGIPFLRSQNVRANKFDPNNLKYIDVQFHEKLKKSALNPNDVVIVRSGNVGVSCVIPNHLKEANCADLVIVKKPLGIIPTLLSIYMNAVTQSRISKHKVGVALAHFNTQSVANFPIPIPPIKEQAQIVQGIEGRFSIVDSVEETIYKRIRQAQLLRQSILKRAFEGKLVPHDSNDEPASVLLERIKEEKEKAKKSKQLEMF
jgi:type I restriction enzyme S subunit